MRGHPEAGVGVHGPVRLDISVAEAPGPYQLVSRDDTNYRARQPTDLDLTFHPGGEEVDLSLDLRVGCQGGLGSGPGRDGEEESSCGQDGGQGRARH